MLLLGATFSFDIWKKHVSMDSLGGGGEQGERGLQPNVLFTLPYVIKTVKLYHVRLGSVGWSDTVFFAIFETGNCYRSCIFLCARSMRGKVLTLKYHRDLKNDFFKIFKYLFLLQRKIAKKENSKFDFLSPKNGQIGFGPGLRKSNFFGVSLNF